MNKSPAALFRHSRSEHRVPGIYPRARFRAVNYVGPIVEVPEFSRAGVPQTLSSLPLNAKPLTIVDYRFFPTTDVLKDYGTLSDHPSAIEDFGTIP